MIECRRCGYCCGHPCGLEPEDIPIIARFLNLTEKELYDKYLKLDYWIGDHGNEYYVCPRRRNDDDLYADFSWALDREPCIFLQGVNECLIHPVKPRGGRECNPINDKHCQSTFGKEEAKDAWKGKIPDFT